MRQPNTEIEESWQRQRVRVPRDDVKLFARPSLDKCVNAVRQNFASLAESNVNIQGRPLSNFREWARRQLLQVARNYTAELHNSPLKETDFHSDAAKPIILGGHQPALFHAGVWVKNFALHHLATQTNGTAINLVVDNDIRSNSSIRVPVGDRRHPQSASIPFDDSGSQEPWEESHVGNRAMFESFGDRVEEAMAAWSVRPVLSEMWPEVISRANQSSRLADCLTAGRSLLEKRWGLQNLELPISRMCTVDPFLWFAGHLFAHAEQFREIHNNVLREFRSVNRIRSRTHPVPELALHDGWIESPFWFWTENESRRSRVLARQVGKEVHLAAGTETFAKLPLTPSMDACCAVEVLRDLPAQGIRLRTRALTTTLFSRLCFGDLFVHGIGGSKYDEMTDRIIARFFGIAAPKFLTLSATLHLPLGETLKTTQGDLTQLIRQRRDVHNNPDRYLNSQQREQCLPLLEEKQRLIAQQHAAHTTSHTRRERRLAAKSNHDRYQSLIETNRELFGSTHDFLAVLDQTISRTRDELAANSILENREYSFCLFPEDKLKPFMTSLDSIR
jgi:hypothetical protein